MALSRRATAANSGEDALSEIRAILGLSEQELAELFNVRRESVLGWRKHGVPPARRASVARLLDLARVLTRDIKPDRIPEIVRTHDDWLPHGTMLATIAREGPDAVYAYLRRLFSYAG
jgi:transcriptional regulator with XRE-family HTH domain